VRGCLLDADALTVFDSAPKSLFKRCGRTDILFDTQRCEFLSALRRIGESEFKQNRTARGRLPGGLKCCWLLPRGGHVGCRSLRCGCDRQTHPPWLCTVVGSGIVAAGLIAGPSCMGQGRDARRLRPSRNGRDAAPVASGQAGRRRACLRGFWSGKFGIISFARSARR